VLLSPICLFSPIAFCVFFCCILSNFPLLFFCDTFSSVFFCLFWVLKMCLKANQTRRRTSLCPDCRGYITNMLYPSSVLLGDIMDLTVVPYGNAQESFDGQRYVFTCQHGEQECLGNMIQACLLNLTKTNAFNIIFCMEAAVNVIQAAKPCVELFAPQLSYEKLMSCVKGDLGNHLMHQNALKTEALKPPHTFVPWITINGIHTDDLQKKAMSSLIPLVCSMYKRNKNVTKRQQKHNKEVTKAL
uniref:Gamma-interferon-inducible lysosomal thiol reductase n=1 Tax=Neogobius melanostomus TaxID=47308 RepID=A0A8C6TZY3_9GOBI